MDKNNFMEELINIKINDKQYKKILHTNVKNWISIYQKGGGEDISYYGNGEKNISLTRFGKDPIIFFLEEVITVIENDRDITTKEENKYELSQKKLEYFLNENENKYFILKKNDNDLEEIFINIFKNNYLNKDVIKNIQQYTIANNKEKKNLIVKLMTMCDNQNDRDKLLDIFKKLNM